MPVTRRQMGTAVSPPEGVSEDDDSWQELVTLRRKMRILGSRDKQYCERQENKLLTQKRLIEAVERENGELKRALSLQVTQKDKMVQDMTDLLERQDVWKEQVTVAEKDVKELDKEILDLQKSHDKQKRDMGGLLMADAKRHDVSRQQMCAQKRLENSATKFNSTLATNTRLRDVISHLQHERKTFYEIHRKTHGLLQSTRDHTKEVVNLATNAYEGREESRNKMVALKEKAKKDLTHYTQQIKEFQRRIDHEQRLQDFMKVKEEERTGDFEALLTQRKEETELKEKEDILVTYEEAFARIREITELHDINDIVRKFVEVEDQNFALFNYVSELNSDIDQVHDEISHARAEMGRFEADGASLEASREQMLRGMEADLSQSEAASKEHDTRLTQANKLLGQLMKGIGGLFTKIGCNAAVISDMLGGQQGVTENNIIQHMGQIEQRTDELLELKSYIAAKESEDPNAAVSLLLPKPDLTISFDVTAEIVPPAIGDDSVEGSELELLDNKPMTQDELRDRMNRFISRRETDTGHGIQRSSASSRTKSTHERKRTQPTPS